MEKKQKESDSEDRRAVLKELEKVFVGVSEHAAAVRNQIYKASKKNNNVLILGERGTGKEVVASQIHKLWARRKGIEKEMVTVCCTDVPEGLWESELFGAEKGAFTDARTREGWLRQANESTLFLDEIGDIPLRLQNKLRKVIQSKTVKPVGGDKEYPLTSRLISATNRNLPELCEAEPPAFKPDLFDRLNEIAIQILPLRERREDILPVFIHFLEKYHPEYGRETYRLYIDQLLYLVMSEWKGNVRELESWVRSADLSESHEAPLSSIFLKDPKRVEDFAMNCFKKSHLLADRRRVAIDLIGFMGGWQLELDPLPPGTQLSKAELMYLVEHWAYPPEPPEYMEEFPEEPNMSPKGEDPVIEEKGAQGDVLQSHQPSSSEPLDPNLALETLASKPTPLDEVERLYLTEVLKKHPIKKRAKGRSPEALAKRLGISPETLRKKIAGLNLS